MLGTSEWIIFSPLLTLCGRGKHSALCSISVIGCHENPLAAMNVLAAQTSSPFSLVAYLRRVGSHGVSFPAIVAGPVERGGYQPRHLGRGTDAAVCCSSRLFSLSKGQNKG